MAVGSGRKKIQIFDTGDTACSVMERYGNTPSSTVEMIDLDSFAEEHIHDKIGFIKSDIEGAMLDALRGMKKVITSNRPVLSLSIYHNTDEFFEVKPLLEEMVENLNYKITIQSLFPVASTTCEVVIFAYPRELSD